MSARQRTCKGGGTDTHSRRKPPHNPKPQGAPPSHCTHAYANLTRERHNAWQARRTKNVATLDSVVECVDELSDGIGDCATAASTSTTSTTSVAAIALPTLLTRPIRAIRLRRLLEAVGRTSASSST